MRGRSDFYIKVSIEPARLTTIHDFLRKVLWLGKLFDHGFYETNDISFDSLIADMEN